MQMLEINYEDLIKHPKEHIQRIQRMCDFVDLPVLSFFSKVISSRNWAMEAL